MSKFDELRKSRTSKKSSLTRRINELRRLVVEDSRSLVIEKFDAIKDTFADFVDTHNKYHDLLTDESETIVSDAYYDDVENKYIEGLAGVSVYLKGESKPIMSHVPNPTSQVETTRSSSYIKLPPAPKPEVFTGAKSELYPLWKASFNTLVGKHNIDFDAKMFYLKSYTAGDAQSAIEALFMCPSKDSYEAALQILEDRFGNASEVTSGFRRKLENWPRVGDRDGKGLQKFSDYLKQICVAKKTYKALNILSDEFENQKILSKLPSWLVKQWIEKVVESTTFPDFDKFSDFISDKAKIENHSLWSDYSSKPVQKPQPQGHSHATYSKPGKQKSDEASGGGSSLPNPETDKRRTCVACNQAHKVVECPKFIGMSLPDRKKFIMDNNMCFGCLTQGHYSRKCRIRHTCEVCSKKHPTLLHDYNIAPPDSTNLATNTPHSTDRMTTSILPVLIRHSSNDKEILVYALLDTQSNTHFITNEVVDMLGLSGQDTTLKLTTMNGRMNVPTQLIDGLEVKGVCEENYITIAPCFTRESIPCNRDSIPTADIVETWSHLSEVQLPPYYENAPVGILIGYHCPQAMRPSQVVCGSEAEPYAWKTGLGWCIIGSSGSTVVEGGEVDEFGTSHVVQGCIALQTMCSEVMFERDNSSCMHDVDDKYSVEDIRFLKIMETQMVQLDDKHYQAPVPVKGDDPFPLNKGVVLKKLLYLKSRFKRDPVYRQKYSAVVQEMLELGFAEVVPENDVGIEGRTWYIPHHGVLQDKLRVVFDCSSQFKGICLNDRLLQGPNLMNLMLGILIRFRLEAVAFTCDVKKMFYQFMVPPADRDLFRFLWWKDGDVDSDPIACRMRVHLFGATSSPGIATYGLRKIATDYKHKYMKEASDFVIDDFYVDDGVKSVNTSSKATALFLDTQKLLAEGGLVLHKVMSNSEEVCESVPVEHRAPVDESKLHKTLGIPWNIENDEFHFKLDFDRSKSTRRGLLSNLSSFFDPLGMISPLVHQGRLLFHQMCRENYQWDDNLSGHLLKEYVKWCDLIDHISVVTVSRRLFSCNERSDLQIHHFADASTTGYAACSYLRYIDDRGCPQVSFLLGKCRVVPFKPVLSVPRLELLAAVLSVELATKLRKALPLDCPEYFWSDSTVVLGYIQNEASRFKVFVANRVQRIHDGSQPDQWHHVDTQENPADDGSRGVWSKRWLVGPKFLHDATLDIDDPQPVVSDGDVELRCLTTSADEATVDFHINTLKNWFSTLKVWSWVQRFIDGCRGIRRTGTLSVYEIDQSKKQIIGLVQQSSFPDELLKLNLKSRIPHSSKLHKLDVFLDSDGLIRVGGRIRMSGLSYDIKHPVVLPSDHVVTLMIIQHFHLSIHHQGRGMTCAEIRNHGFWIIRLQPMVKQLIHSCVTCSRLRGRPCEQKMADLPQDRITPSPPFAFSGCDLFGPFVIRSGRREVKRYAVIFTCLVSRAVHLEVVYTLSSDSFLNAFRRFVSLRGHVQELRCDQGTNFVGSRNELLKMGCDLVLNPPASSHRGGVWERMIGTARRIIEAILCEHAQRLDEEGLMTVLSETASVINSRPLSVDNVNDPQSLEPLTPHHLITMKSCVIHQLPSDLYPTHMYARKQWQRVQYMVDLFWTRWKREIIHQNMTRSKWNTIRQNLQVDDVVLVVDEQSHRSFWKLARVSDIVTSKDGLVRSVRIRLADGTFLERPVQKLVHLLSS